MIVYILVHRYRQHVENIDISIDDIAPLLKIVEDRFFEFNQNPYKENKWDGPKVSEQLFIEEWEKNG